MFLNGEVNEDSSNLLIAELLYLESEDQKAPIWIYINSPGGSVMDGLQIIDTMKLIKAPVCTLVTGLAASMGCMIAAAGYPGRRYALEHAQIMAHQVSSGTSGHVADQRASLDHAERLNDLLMNMLSQYVGMDRKKLMPKVNRDCWLSAEEAKNFGTKGIVDKVVKTREDIDDEIESTEKNK